MKKNMFKKVSLTVCSLIISFSVYSPLNAFAESENKFKDLQSTYEIDSNELKKTIDFRKEFGLSVDQTFLIEQIKNKNKSSLDVLGVSLSEAEEKELLERFNNQNAFIPKVKKTMKTKGLESSFAGLYVDQANGGVINIGIKDDLSKQEYIELKKELKLLYNDENKVNFYQAKMSEEDLDKLSEKVGSDLKELNTLGINILSFATDLPTQKLIIYVDNLNKETISLLEKRYGKEKITVKLGEKAVRFASRTDYTRPIKGGLSISNSYGVAGNYCSSGYSASRNGSYYIITAAHCDTTANYETWTQGGSAFGMSSSYKKESGNVDAIAITLSSSSNRSNEVFGSLYKLSSTQKRSEAYVGQAVSKSGARTGTTTGTIKTLNFSGTSDGIYWTGLIGTSASSAKGDSGGTVYQNAKLMGILWGGFSTYPMIFSHVEAITTSLGMNPVFN